MSMGHSSTLSSARGCRPATSWKNIQLYEPSTSWWMPERPNVWVTGFQLKKNSLLSGNLLSPLMSSFQDSHSMSCRYMSGVMDGDGYRRSAEEYSRACSVALMFEKLFEPWLHAWQATSAAWSAWLAVYTGMMGNWALSA